MTRARGEKATLLLLILAALALRWHHVHEISLFVDEFVTAWAARAILAHGLPVLPSGTLYPHGLLFSYLAAPFVAGGLDETMLRLPGLIAGVAMVPVTWAVGRRLLSPAVGLVAAAALAVDPDCIAWGARARMYGLLQLLTLLAVYFFYRGFIRGGAPAGDRPRDRWLAAGLLILAIWTHAEAILLLPVLAAAALVARPWPSLLRPRVAAPLAAAGAGAVAYTAIAALGQPEHLATVQAARPYLEIGLQPLASLAAFAPTFIQPHRLAMTLLAGAGLVVAWRRQQHGHVDNWGQTPLTYLYDVLILFLLPFLLLAGSTWHNERYLYLLLPILFLAAADALWQGVRRLVGAGFNRPAIRRAAPWAAAGLAFGVALFGALAGHGVAARQEPGYDLAFRYLRARQPAPDEAVLTFSPPAAALYLDSPSPGAPRIYFAVQRDYQEYVVARPGDGRPADIWTASPLLDTTGDLVKLLESAPRVWLVVDEWRFQTRYEPDFILTVLDSMALEYHAREVMVFAADGYRPPAGPAARHRHDRDFGALWLTAFDLSQPEQAVRAGRPLEVTLHWQAVDAQDSGYLVDLALIDAGGQAVAHLQEPVLRDLYRPTFWPPGQSVPDRHYLDLPRDLPPGPYRLCLDLRATPGPAAMAHAADDCHAPLITLSIVPELP